MDDEFAEAGAEKAGDDAEGGVDAAAALVEILDRAESFVVVHDGADEAAETFEPLQDLAKLFHFAAQS
ncbi:MAG TPA: hypothetical protein VHW03_06720 [Chthoniobacterales bacterium]|nr:hypothetical protein [Chthoniobacterales bacterium]